ncbi:MAG: 2'-deoxycytidine 5'-triphosphate deaminase [Rhizobiales bacterium]|nr:2'-deoxycytidine 5'-triphosphate deaminase [Hyphomicrobiales bacterium]
MYEREYEFLFSYTRKTNWWSRITGKKNGRQNAPINRFVFSIEVTTRSAPNKLYGTGIGSNCQAQSLKLSKHFKA